MNLSSPLHEIERAENTAFNRDGALLLKGMLADQWASVLADGLEYANDHSDGMSK